MFTLGYNKFLIEINYKSGIQKRFWCYEFSNNKIGADYWPVHQSKPVDLFCSNELVESIESVWTLAVRRGLLGTKK
jgi:hypothetical protein